MEVKCYKTMDCRGKIYVPVFVREAVGIDKNDVVQIMGRGGVILINKASVNAENPIEMIQNEIRTEKEIEEQEKNRIKNRIKQMLDEGHSMDEVLDEALHFLF